MEHFLGAIFPAQTCLLRAVVWGDAISARKSLRLSDQNDAIVSDRGPDNSLELCCRGCPHRLLKWMENFDLDMTESTFLSSDAAAKKGLRW